MPTIVHFVGNESITLEESFDNVNMQLAGVPSGGQFTVKTSMRDTARVTVYRDNVLYIEDSE